jgi:Ca2+-binding EF-hand superfamily protein
MANTSDEMRQYREAFSLFDKDHDNIIAPQELGRNNYLFIYFNVCI